jgi:hypothetical protein
MLRWMQFAAIPACCLLCVPAPAQQTTKPIQIQDNLIRVPVTLNGQPLDAVLDSGTGALAIDYAFAQSLHLDIGASIGMVPGGGPPEPMYPVILDHLDFGPEHLSFTPAIAVDLSHLTASAGFPVHLLLGLPVFRQNILRVDYPARTLTFLPAAPPCADPLPFTLYGGSPLITATVRATPGAPPQTVHLIVDLGTRHYAAILGGKFLSSASGQALQSSSQSAGHTSQIATGTGGAVMGATASIASLTIANRTFPNLTVALTHDIGILEKGVAEGTLGVPLWQNGAVTFDYTHKTVCFDLPR